MRETDFFVDQIERGYRVQAQEARENWPGYLSTPEAIRDFRVWIIGSEVLRGGREDETE